MAEEIEALGRRCLKVWCDLTVTEQIQAMVHQTVSTFGQIDILVNNARAIMGHDRALVTDLREDVWRHFLAVNTTAVFLCTKFVGQAMIRQARGGRIINIASDASKRTNPYCAAYSSSKFAVLGLTQASAVDLARYQITVNAVCPGPVNTDRLSYWEQAQAREQGVSIEEFRSRLVAEKAKATPLGRIAESEDVANLVVFLVSEKASFITGQAYNVNGGLLFH